MEQMEMQAPVSEGTRREEREARELAKAPHESHRQGTVAGCILCEDVAYEPGWYALLASFARTMQDPMISIPNAAVLQV